MKKKFLGILLTFGLLTVALTGCGKKAKEDSKSTSSSSETANFEKQTEVGDSKKEEDMTNSIEEEQNTADSNSKKTKQAKEKEEETTTKGTAGKKGTSALKSKTGRKKQTGKTQQKPPVNFNSEEIQKFLQQQQAAQQKAGQPKAGQPQAGQPQAGQPQAGTNVIQRTAPANIGVQTNATANTNDAGKGDKNQDNKPAAPGPNAN